MGRIQHGTVIKKSGSWYGMYSQWSLNPDGVKIRHQHAFRISGVNEMTKADARRILAARIETELHLRADRKMTVQGFIESRWLPLRQSSWRDSTKKTNLYLLKLITEKFGALPLEALDAVQLQIWVDELAKTRSKGLTHHVRIFLRSIFSEACESDYIRKSPARLLRVPVDLRPVLKPFLTVPQIQALLQAAQGTDRVLLAVAFSTALRPGELLALEWRDFQPGEQKLKVVRTVWNGKVRDYTKTTDADSSRTLTQVFLPESVVSALEQWRTETAYPDDHDFIFAAEYGGSQWRAGVAERLRALAVSVGIPTLDFRMIRRTVATLVQGLGSAKDVQAVLRHSKPETALAHYSQPQEESVRQAVDRLDRLLKG
jgi:integrase